MVELVVRATWVLVLLGLMNHALVEPAAGQASSLSQHGLSVAFSEEHGFGQYANGDYWIVGPVELVQVSPGWDGLRHGAMVSPEAAGAHGYHAQVFGYDAALNVATQLPRSLAPGDSLIVSHGWLADDEGAPSVPATMAPAPRPSLRDAAVFTIVDAPPPPGAFRPPYTNVALDTFTVDQLNWHRLTNMPALDSAPAWATHEQRTERVWIDHKPYWSGRYIQPSNNMVAYGREIAQHFNEATLKLLMDHPQHEKQQTLINLVQIGIDFYGNILSAHASDWYTGSAHNAWTGDWGGAIGTGRKWPILFAGLMLGDQGMVDIVSQHRGDWQEDSQTYYDDQGNVTWTDRNATRGFTDGFDNGYRLCCTANVWNGAALSALIMGARDDWGHDPFFDYVDWHMNPDNEDKPEWQRGWTPFLREAWDTWRPLLDELIAGDMNRDGVVDTADVAPFVLGLTDREAYVDQYGIDPVLVGDINGDGVFDTADVAAFVQLLVGDGSGSAAVPEPGSIALLGLGALALLRRWRAAP